MWLYSIFSNEMLAEACIDGIVQKAVRFTLKGESIKKILIYLHSLTKVAEYHRES